MPLYHLLVSHPIPTFYAKIPAFYANIPCYLGLYTMYPIWCARGAFLCVARRRLQLCLCCYPNVQFNLVPGSLIPDPSLVTVPAEVWGSKLCGSSISRTWQQRYQCVRLNTPVLKKGVLTFFCHDSTELRDHD